jgi:hypothetical protein
VFFIDMLKLFSVVMQYAKNVSWAADVSVLSYRLMVDTTDIDFEVTSSERYGI